ncbi:LOW QUALITY PROTEIN: protein diaphanous homolog 3-like [Osmerus eperlanus]|uniref:LOW QUALITY PROTEIN: protein diaphanous homolog 3-like n=1 Tax=Osmerus eperlanus TaxID=29151 RepID=UPI002E14AA26
MENSYQQRFDSSGRDGKLRKKGFTGALGASSQGTSSFEEGERKPKFHVSIRHLTGDVLDRFASIRIPGSKKDRPPLPHLKPSSSSDWSSSSSSAEFEELSSKITSEKEILALFEKMMEDMNLNEDKRAPLRQKDLSTKREMVLQYVVTASKAGSLRSRNQVSPQEFLGELKSGATDERLFACLDSLRVSLTSNPLPPPPPPPPAPGAPGGPPPPPPPPSAAWRPPSSPHAGVPPPFGAPPPHPRQLPGLSSPPHHALPYGLRPRKDFKPETSMKRLNWSKIRPQEMSESCFWVLADEDRYDNPALLSRLALTFGCQRPARREEEFEQKTSIKKRVKHLKVLDPKIAQNLSIFLGSFRMPYQEIRRMILEVDEEQLTEPMIQNLVKHLPEQEQLNALAQFQDQYSSLSEPEQFGVVMGSVKRLRPRLNHILFRLQFEEQVSLLRPDMLAVSAACEEVRRSVAFRRLLQLVLLLGNYMNAGSRNAQSYGFNLSSLCKLKDTKSADQQTTLLHFLAQVCEQELPDLLHFLDDLQHVDRASRVSAENLEKCLKQMDCQLLQLERDLDTFSSPLQDDLFHTKMASFVQTAREQQQKLVVTHANMDVLYCSMVEFFAVDPKKTSVEEVFTDLSNFRAMFAQALKENVRRREAEEKKRRARAAQEQAEREKRERQQKKKRLLEGNADNNT